MRLYLSSLGVGDHPAHLVEVTGAAATVGVVLNAIDDRPSSDQELAWEIERDELEHLGLRPVRLDLRDPSSLEQVETINSLWVRGGNTFVLRAAMAQHGADAIIRRRTLDSSLGYAGYSAGAVVLVHDLATIAGIDDPHAAGPDPIMTGLGILDRPLVPHVDSTAYEEGRRCAALDHQLTADGVEHHALRDGDALATTTGPLRLIPRRP